MKFLSLKLKIKNFFGKLSTFRSNDRVIFIIMINKFLKNAEKYGIELLN